MISILAKSETVFEVYKRWPNGTLTLWGEFVSTLQEDNSFFFSPEKVRGFMPENLIEIGDKLHWLNEEVKKEKMHKNNKPCQD